jgi:hypothetical protein
VRFQRIGGNGFAVDNLSQRRQMLIYKNQFPPFYVLLLERALRAVIASKRGFFASL